MAIAEALDFITVKGFKSIASLRLDLRPINVLIGANGSGKSNFISIFSFLNEIREGRLQDYVRRAGGADQLLHFGSKILTRSKFTSRLRRRKTNTSYRCGPRMMTVFILRMSSFTTG
jgi:predicted ATPase